MRVLFVSDTHLGFDLPAHPRVERRRRGPDFFKNFELALQPALRGEVDVVLHGGDLLYRSRVPSSLAWAALEPLRRVAARGVPVLLVLGNHERSRLPYPMFGVHERLHVFDRARTFTLEARGLRVAFAGFPYVREVRRRFREVLASTAHDAQPADVKVLCVHHCVENATCGPGEFTFKTGDDVIRTDELPPDFAVTLSGHIHRAQVLRPPERGPVVYAGSVERTSFAEAPETKGYVVLELSRHGAERIEFRPLPARPMLTRELEGGSGVVEAARAAIESTPEDAVVQLRVRGDSSVLTAALLRTLAGDRNVTLALGR
jgi:DNA repair exonuclease SbcCD nuclease subunit